MSTLFYTATASESKPSDSLDQVRTTVTTVTDDDASVATTVPEAGRLETDPHTDGGLTPRQVASMVVPRVKYAPATVSHAEHNDALNASISRVGTAAERESQGVRGNGTLGYQDAMTRPADGTAFAETYFARDQRAFNEHVGAYMSPIGEADPETLDEASAVGKARMAERTVVNPYQAMYNNMMNGVQ